MARSAANARKSKKRKVRDVEDKVAEVDQGGWSEIPVSEKFIAYYKAQGIVRDDEWDTFIACCDSPLPVSFRFNRNMPVGALVSRLERGDFDAIAKAVPLDGQDAISAPRLLPWYPSAWHIGCSKRQIKKHPELESLNKWVQSLHNDGFITRQEVVSMIPPLLLDVEPSHIVLDACAAPGSKTAQLLEMLTRETPMPEGFIVANDASPARANNLVHQLNRLNVPCFTVVHYDAQRLPTLCNMQYDRILCDVPCTGDATTRKVTKIWMNWSSGNGISLHRLQHTIASRCVQLLRPGGRMVYSTCSFNPLENEAVVAQLLRDHGDELSLVDVSSRLPGLSRRPGLSTWTVFDRDMNRVETPNADLRESLFPPSAEELSRYHLERCVRVVPHDQDTGGFFIAVLEKSPTAKVPRRFQEAPAVAAMGDDSTSADAVGSGSESQHNGKERQGDARKRRGKAKGAPKTGSERYFRLVDCPEQRELLAHLVDTFGLSSEFPLDRLWCRSGNMAVIRRIHLVNSGVSNLLSNWHAKDAAEGYERVNHAGLTVFEAVRRKDDKVPMFRVAQSGVNVMLPFITRRRARLSLGLFKHLVTEKKMPISDLPEGTVPAQTLGSFVFTTDLDGIAVTAWVGNSYIETMANDVALHGLLANLNASSA
ncbi:unnamed protein product (mitochondrion) [Plasmodiophora brassicae]|uniref:SAM-dependent MTase RsmB/NOP-type domain-containing protein n=1 Tax=Plasmodiophora brassicae TaxID=37360 RepID=A0A0G4IR52_PLABS|nr:hypothetical protein PBRA_005854 [Plasmodiophora brassicae]SPQ98286.1 unnamed protein product [Plasmodiophora brassicae]